VTAPAPDLVEPVVGFRAWRIVGGRLMSPYIPVRWEARVMHAECLPANRRLLFGAGWVAEPHASPHPDCKCGIYAYHRPGVRTWFGEFETVEGVVSCWGRIEVHADGLRAEHARVEALALPRTAPGAIPAVADVLGAPLVPRDELASAAAAYGAPLPASLRPAA